MEDSLDPHVVRICYVPGTAHAAGDQRQSHCMELVSGCVESGLEHKAFGAFMRCPGSKIKCTESRNEIQIQGYWY